MPFLKSNPNAIYGRPTECLAVRYAGLALTRLRASITHTALDAQMHELQSARTTFDREALSLVRDRMDESFYLDLAAKTAGQPNILATYLARRTSLGGKFHIALTNEDDYFALQFHVNTRGEGYRPQVVFAETPDRKGVMHRVEAYPHRDSVEAYTVASKGLHSLWQAELNHDIQAVPIGTLGTVTTLE